MRLIAFLLLLCVVGTSSSAENYGTFGAVFPVEEPSVLDAIFDRLNEMDGNGELAQLEEDMKATTRERIRRPHPVVGLLLTQTYASFEVDLSITLDRDLADHRGVVFAKAGTLVNPLEHSRFSQRLIFIDGDDPDQVAFALAVSRAEPAKIILVNGSPLELTEQHQTLFYFDQGGIISDRFSLRSVPSVVSRSDPLMLVEEIPVPRASREESE